MKNLGWGIIAIILSLSVFTGCDDDDTYSYGNLWVAIGTIEKQGESDIAYTLKLDDDNTILEPISFGYPYFKTEDNQRVVVNYTILGDKSTTETKKYQVQVNALKEILTKDITNLTEENSDSIGNDPVKVDKAWMTNNYLSFRFKYYGGSKTHYINLVKNPENKSEKENEIILELRHNNNDDYAGNVLSGLVSFDLNSLNLTDKQKVDIKIKAKEYENHMYEKTFSYTHSVE